MKTITRFGDLERAFDGGRSPLLNSVARLSVLYEDFRVEHAALMDTVREFDAGGPFENYRVTYFVRRSVATMFEFQGGLTQLVADREFRNAVPRLSELDSRRINEANLYLQKHCPLIKGFRDAIGGHFQYAAAAGAAQSVPTGTIGRITWDSSDDSILALQLHYAENLVAGAISNKLPAGSDVVGEWKIAMECIANGYTHIQGATYALVHAFLWHRFGR